MAEDLVPCSQHDVEEDQFFESCSSTQIEVVKLRHTWTINNFSLCFSEFEDELVSSTFSSKASSDKSEWCLTLVQKKSVNYENLNFYSCYHDVVCNLKLVRSNIIPITVNYVLWIDNAKDKSIATIYDLQSFKINQNSGSLYIFRKDLLKPKNEMLGYDSSDKADIVCEITYNVINGDISKPLKTPHRALAIDFTFLLENKQLSDVTLGASGREFLAHKVILSAGSPVFRAMFQYDTEESRNNWVEITDIDEKELGTMLCYLYTGKINNLKERVHHLLDIAENYELKDLKIRCDKALLKILSLKNDELDTYSSSERFYDKASKRKTSKSKHQKR